MGKKGRISQKLSVGCLIRLGLMQKLLWVQNVFLAKDYNLPFHTININQIYLFCYVN